MQNEKRGKFLLECRKKKKLSQDELGEMISYSRNNISKWERGVSFPSDPNVLEKLADIFDVSIEELMYGEHRSKNNEKEIIENLTNEYKSKYKKLTRKNIIIFSLVIITILIITVFTYLIFIKGTIKVYKVNIDDENFILDDSLLFISNSISVLNLNKVTSKNNEEIKYIELYYYENNKKITIDSSGNETKYIKETNGYSEYNLNDLINKKVYLCIKTNKNDYEDIELFFTEEYVNNNIFPKKVEKISNNFKTSESMSEEFKNKLLQNGFKTTDNENFEKIFSNDIYISVQVNSIDLYINDSENDTFDYFHSFLNSKNILQVTKIKGTKKISKSIKVSSIKNCDEETCSTIEDYVSYINYLKKLYDN